MSRALNRKETKSIDQCNWSNKSLRPLTVYIKLMSDIVSYVFVSAFCRLTEPYAIPPLGLEHEVKVAAAKMSHCMTCNVLIEKES